MARRQAALMAPGFAAIWEFSVSAARQAEFESHYGPEGSWARLFRKSPGYLGTELWQDGADSLRYVTIDRWASGDAWTVFRTRFAADYERLDLECEGLTESESPLGEFAPAGAGRR